MKLIYCCAAFSGDIAYNKKQVEQYAEYIYKQGFIPFVPHLNFSFNGFKTDERRAEVMKLCLGALKYCHELWVFNPSGLITGGMLQEISLAEELFMTVRFFNKNEWETADNGSV